MNNCLYSCIETFFQDFCPDLDPNGTKKMLLSEAIRTFLAEETKENAYDVYRAFLDVYSFQDKPFIDLLCVLRDYEENASVLTDKQRDHFVHAVNVFLLGLSIYARNEKYRLAVDGFLGNEHFATHREEFFFRWGVAALFHDIGYPVEIVANQLKEYIRRIANNDKKLGNEIGAHISYLNLGKLNSLKLSDIQSAQAKAMADMGADICQPTDLLACIIAETLGAPFDKLNRILYTYLFSMQQNGFVDHGYYSALITIKWYGEILGGSEGDARLFLDCILDSAAAIFLHNAYKNVMMKEPFSLPPLKAEKSPISYLLILCDEAQEWNREAYGMIDRAQIQVDASGVEVDNLRLRLHYVTKSGLMSEDKIRSKNKVFTDLLDIQSVFSSGVMVTAATPEGKIDLLREPDEITPRLLLRDLDKLARSVFDDYNDKQRLRNPEKPLEYPNWDNLPDSIKYSNYHQARDLVNKVNLLGYRVSDEGAEEITAFSEKQVEQLAIYEHRRWIEDRLKNGWTYGEERDAGKKTSPYLVAYEDLPEDIKELDRDAVRNILPLLHSVGLRVFRQSEGSREEIK